MLFTTPTQWIILALALIAGWLLGLASSTGGRKWRDRYATERDAHAATRAQADAQVADARRGTDARLAAANARVAELEAENRRLASTGAVVVHPPRPIEREVAGDTPVYAPDPVRPTPNVAPTSAAAARPPYIPARRTSGGPERAAAGVADGL